MYVHGNVVLRDTQTYFGLKYQNHSSKQIKYLFSSIKRGLRSQDDVIKVE
jgi:hypothetical protein